jgi:hypothetical protein
LSASTNANDERRRASEHVEAVIIRGGRASEAYAARFELAKHSAKQIATRGADRRLAGRERDPRMYSGHNGSREHDLV